MEENIENSEPQAPSTSSGQEASENQPVQETPQSQGGCNTEAVVEASTNSCNLGMLSHLLGVFTGFVGSLIIWLLKKDEDEFVEANAKEALNFQITVCLCAALLLVTMIFAFLLLPLIVLDMVFCIIGAVKAGSGQKYRYPLSIRLIK